MFDLDPPLRPLRELCGHKIMPWFSEPYVNSRKDVQSLNVIEARLNTLLPRLLETEQAPEPDRP